MTDYEKRMIQLMEQMADSLETMAAALENLEYDLVHGDIDFGQS